MELKMVEVACVLCGNTVGRAVLRAPDRQLDLSGLFTVNECLKCGHYFTNPRPAAGQQDILYPESYAVFSSGRSAKRWHTWRRRVQRLLVARLIRGLPSGNGARALELGSGTGNFLDVLRVKGWQVEGLEPSRHAVSVAAEAGRPVMNADDRYLQALPSETYGLVAALMVIEHLEDPVASLKELHRITAPRGELLVSVPNFDSLERLLFRDHWYALQLPRHYHHFTPASISRTLEAAGWSNIRIQFQWTALDFIKSLASVVNGYSDRLSRWIVRASLPIDLAFLPFSAARALVGSGSRMTVRAVKQ